MGAGGVCGCANVLSSLMTCSTSQLGTRTMMGSTSQLCPVVTDSSVQQMLANAQTPQAIAIDFSDIAISYCSLGGYQNLCLNVHIPLMDTSGIVEASYVVLLELLSIVEPGSAGRRRLLSILPLSSSFFSEWMQQHASESSPCIASAAHNDRRDKMKKCLYWENLASFTVKHFNLSEPLLSTELLPNLWQDPHLRTFLLTQMPFGHSLVQTVHGMHTFWKKLPAIHHDSRRKILSSNADVVEENNHTSAIPMSRGDWEFNCTSVQIPLDKITGAFWDTVEYYSQEKTNSSLSCDISQGLSNCLGYSLPPSESSTQDSSVSQILLYVPTLGMGGNRVMDALLSPISYEDAQTQDYITGQRIMQDMGTCNFTRLTLGPMKQRSFLAMFCFLVILFTILSYMCMPFSACAWFLWYLLFPITLFWCLYNISPLCWPMIPPNFISDINMEINSLFPTDLSVPRYLVKPQCTVQGTLSDGTYDPACFGSCSDPPFLFTSWQVSINIVGGLRLH